MSYAYKYFILFDSGSSSVYIWLDPQPIQLITNEVQQCHSKYIILRNLFSIDA